MFPNRLISRSLILMFAVFLASAAFADNSRIVISPQSIVVNPIPSFRVNVNVDRDLSGDRLPTYYIGENIRISVSVNEDAYVYLFAIRSSGSVDQILPNFMDAFGRNNYLYAGQTRTFPAHNAGYTFMVDGPRGLDKVIAVASKEPLNTSTLASFNRESSFASSNLSQQSFAENLRIVVTPLPQSSWVTDTAQFYVR